MPSRSTGSRAQPNDDEKGRHYSRRRGARPAWGPDRRQVDFSEEAPCRQG